MKIKRVLALLLAFVLTVTATLPASAASTNISAWAQADITEAAQAGIVPGDLPTDYTQPITRAQFCNIAVKLYETVRGAAITGRSEFTDTADVNVQKMAYLGVVNGYGDGVFGPNDTLTREQAAAILSRLAGQLNISMRTVAIPYTDVATSWARADIIKVYSIEVMTGTSSTTFDPSMHYTIEQSIVTMLRLYKKAANTGNPQESQPPAGNIVASGFCGEDLKYTGVYSGGENLTWTLDSNGLLTISGTGKMGGSPWYSYYDQIKRVIIEEGVTSISKWAFYEYSSLASISIPKSVASIGEYALSGCNSLENITMPGALTYTINSPDDIAGFREALCSCWPSIVAVYVPADQLDKYQDTVESHFIQLKAFGIRSRTNTNIISTISGSEYALIVVSFNENQDEEEFGVALIRYHQGYLPEVKEVNVELYEQAKVILSKIITSGMSEYQKVKTIHDYLINNTSYDLYAENQFNPRGPILDGKAVCDGYTTAFMLLCEMSDVHCLRVSGAYGQASHSWNKVRVDGAWYNVDVTLDDPGKGSPKYTYFLVSDSQLAKNHTWEKEWVDPYYPAAPVKYSK